MNEIEIEIEIEIDEAQLLVARVALASISGLVVVGVIGVV